MSSAARKRRVTIAMPVYEHVKAETMTSLIAALVELRDEWLLTVQRGCYIDQSREVSVAKALEAESDYLVFIDSDMAFQPDAITKLLAHGKDIVGGVYNQKGLPLRTTVKLDNGDGQFVDGPRDIPLGLFPCAAVATGFMAINLRRMTKLLKPPYFAFTNEVPDLTSAWAAGPGEDTAFCLRARKAGLEVWGDSSIPLKHLGEYAY
jgi:hypothetical protein